MRIIFKRTAVLWVATLLAVAVVACGGSATKRDVRRVEKKCGVVAGSTVTEDQARCIARIFGIRDTRGCPMEVARPEGVAAPAYLVYESCNGLGVVVSESTGRVMAIVSGDGVLID